MSSFQRSPDQDESHYCDSCMYASYRLEDFDQRYETICEKNKIIGGLTAKIQDLKDDVETQRQANSNIRTELENFRHLETNRIQKLERRVNKLKHQISLKDKQLLMSKRKYKRIRFVEDDSSDSEAEKNEKKAIQLTKEVQEKSSTIDAQNALIRNLYEDINLQNNQNSHLKTQNKFIEQKLGKLQQLFAKMQSTFNEEFLVIVDEEGESGGEGENLDGIIKPKNENLEKSD